MLLLTLDLYLLPSKYLPPVSHLCDLPPSGPPLVSKLSILAQSLTYPLLLTQDPPALPMLVYVPGFYLRALLLTQDLH